MQSHECFFDSRKEPGGTGAYLVEDLAVDVDGSVECFSLGNMGAVGKYRAQWQSDARDNLFLLHSRELQPMQGGLCRGNDAGLGVGQCAVEIENECLNHWAFYRVIKSKNLLVVFKGEK